MPLDKLLSTSKCQTLTRTLRIYKKFLIKKRYITCYKLALFKVNYKTELRIKHGVLCSIEL